MYLRMFAFTLISLISLNVYAAHGRTYRFSGEYGSLKYRGTVTRASHGVDYIYTVNRMELTFVPNSKINSTSKISVTSIDFVTTKRRTEGSWKQTFSDSHKVHLLIDKRHRSTTIEKFSFTVPRSDVSIADNAGITVTDGHLMWPIEHDFR